MCRRFREKYEDLTEDGTFGFEEQA